MIGINNRRITFIVCSFLFCITLIGVIVFMKKTTKAVSAPESQNTEESVPDEDNQKICGMPPELLHCSALTGQEQEALKEALRTFFSKNTLKNGDTGETLEVCDEASFNVIYMGKFEGELLVTGYIYINEEYLLCHVGGYLTNGDVVIKNSVYWPGSLRDEKDVESYMETLFGVDMGSYPVNGLENLDMDAYGKWRLDKYNEYIESQK